VKVFNLTDVPTSALTSRHMVNVPVKVAGVVIKPGTVADVPDKPVIRSLIRQQFETIGVLSMDAAPKGYTGAAGREEPPPPQEKEVEKPGPAWVGPKTQPSTAGEQGEGSEGTEETEDKPAPPGERRRRRRKSG
jgi:hypothetical protein